MRLLVAAVLGALRDRGPGGGASRPLQLRRRVTRRALGGRRRRRARVRPRARPGDGRPRGPARLRSGGAGGRRPWARCSLRVSRSPRTAASSLAGRRPRLPPLRTSSRSACGSPSDSRARPGSCACARCCSPTTRSTRRSSTSTKASALTQAILDRGRTRLRVLRRHAPGRVRGRPPVRAGRHPPHPDRPGPPAVPGRPAAARRLDPAARARRHARSRWRTASRCRSRRSNIVSPPARIIEPAIALSIVYVGADNLLVRGGRDVRAWIAFALRLHPRLRLRERAARDGPAARARSAGRCSRSTSASKSASCWSSCVVASALAALRSRSEAAGRRLAFAGSVVVMAAGAFWFIQRVFFPLEEIS